MVEEETSPDLLMPEESFNISFFSSLCHFPRHEMSTFAGNHQDKVTTELTTKFRVEFSPLARQHLHSKFIEIRLKCLSKSLMFVKFPFLPLSLRHVEVSKMAENSKFQKIENFKNCDNVRHSVKYRYFEFQFSATILNFIVLIDSTKKTLGYRRSCWVTFEMFRFSRGPKSGFP